MLSVPDQGRCRWFRPVNGHNGSLATAGLIRFRYPDDNALDAHRTRFACAAPSAPRPLIERFGFVPSSFFFPKNSGQSKRWMAGLLSGRCRRNGSRAWRCKPLALEEVGPEGGGEGSEYYD